MIENGFDDLEDFKKYMGSLERSLKRANQGGEDDHEEEEIDPSSAWPLVDIPDDQLTAEQIKEKRKQKLHKANFEARERNKEIKRQEEEARLQFEKEQQEWRDRDLDDWCTTKRLKLERLLANTKKNKNYWNLLKIESLLLHNKE